jgi:putative aldouronate transport system substrate-binding protein
MDTSVFKAMREKTNVTVEMSLASSPETTNNYPGAVTFNVDESERFYTLYNDIDTYLDENLLGFIIGTTPLDQYDSFRDTLISMGIEECIELTQAALDRYNAR